MIPLFLPSYFVLSCKDCEIGYQDCASNKIKGLHYKKYPSYTEYYTSIFGKLNFYASTSNSYPITASQARKDLVLDSVPELSLNKQNLQFVESQCVIWID